MRRVDTLLVLTDSSRRGLQTVSYIKNMVTNEKVIECSRLGVVFNRVSGDEDLLSQSASEIAIDVLGFVPPDSNITRFDLVGRPLSQLPDESSALVAVRKVAARLLADSPGAPAIAG